MLCLLPWHLFPSGKFWLQRGLRFFLKSLNSLNILIHFSLWIGLKIVCFFINQQCTHPHYIFIFYVDVLLWIFDPWSIYKIIHIRWHFLFRENYGRFQLNVLKEPDLTIPAKYLLIPCNIMENGSILFFIASFTIKWILTIRPMFFF